MLITENIKLAIYSIKSNKMRSFLTMLGIIIGISSVITITSLGDTSKRVLSKEFESFGKNRVIMYMPFGNDTIRDSDLFTMDDINAVKERFGKDIDYMAPYINASSDTRMKRDKYRLNIIGVDNGYDSITQISMVQGRFLTEGDVKGKRLVGVADKSLTDKMFPGENPLGKEIPVVVSGTPSMVSLIGVFEKENSIFAGLMSSDSTDFYMPYTLFPDQFKSMGALDFKVSEAKSSEEVSANVESFLAKSKGREPGFYFVQSTEQQQQSIDGMLSTVSLAIGAIAAISLIVGGIGIMNIMLVSVTERTREIGIRKSLGARRKDILLQFLIEAMIVSATGGIIGTTLGLIFSAVIAVALKVTPVIDPTMVVISVIFSAVVGMFFGLYPANRAAKLDPIDALRYE